MIFFFERRFSVLLAVICAGGCAWTVRPPAEVADPAPVYITEYGRHTRVALPANGGTFLEYGFGEWNFYALERNDGISGLRAISGMGSGALSRRSLPDPGGAGFPGGGKTGLILVERSKAEDLRTRLDARWERNQEHMRVREWDAVPVSRDPERYYLFNNSNHASARWLRELGCEVRGTPVFSNFTVLQPEP